MVIRCNKVLPTLIINIKKCYPGITVLFRGSYNLNLEFAKSKLFNLLYCSSQTLFKNRPQRSHKLLELGRKLHSLRYEVLCLGTVSKVHTQLIKFKQSSSKTQVQIFLPGCALTYTGNRSRESTANPYDFFKSASFAVRTGSPFTS
jgi:hypothetical protein